MSIIYDALKKTQGKRQEKTSQSALPKTEKLLQEKAAAMLALREKTIAASKSVATRKPIRLPNINTKILKFVALVCAAIFFAVTLLMVVKNLPVKQKLTDNAVLPKAPEIKPILTVKELLTLNGVFLSDDSKVAFINHRSFTLGDKVNGMIIVAINSKGIKLQKGQETIDLPVAN